MQQKYIDAIQEDVTKVVSHLADKYSRQLDRARIKYESLEEISDDLQPIIRESIERHAKEFFESQRGHAEAAINQARSVNTAVGILDDALREVDEGVGSDCGQGILLSAIRKAINELGG